MSRVSQRWFGNFLIIVSLIGIGSIFYPVVVNYVAYFIHSDAESFVQNDTGFSLHIPRIRVQSSIVANVNPWDESVYQDALKTGVAHAKGTVTPDQQGLIYLFAHSSDNPWNVTRYNTDFYRLFMLDAGDEITLFYNGKQFSYRVREMKTVRPSEVSHLTENNQNELILQTCAPIGTSWRRLLVFADPV